MLTLVQYDHVEYIAERADVIEMEAGWPNECYHNASVFVAKHALNYERLSNDLPIRYEYVEGFLVTVGIDGPLPHAWVFDNVTKTVLEVSPINPEMRDKQKDGMWGEWYRPSQTHRYSGFPVPLKKLFAVKKYPILSAAQRQRARAASNLAVVTTCLQCRYGTQTCHKLQKEMGASRRFRVY